MSLIDRGARNQHSEHRHALVRRGSSRAIGREGNPDLMMDREGKIPGHDTDDDTVHAAKLNCPTHGFTIAGEARLPDVVPDYDDRRRAITFVLIQQRPAHERLDARNAKAR